MALELNDGIITEEFEMVYQNTAKMPQTIKFVVVPSDKASGNVLFVY